MEALWDTFAEVSKWPRWNRSFWRVVDRELRVGATLNWFFNPIRPRYLYKLPARATIVEFEPHRRVTWEVTALPGFRARHSYLFEPLGPNRCCFGSYEVAEGPAYERLRRFWLAHFRYVRDESLRGAAVLGRRAAPGVTLASYGESRGRPVLLAIPGIDGSIGSIQPIVERLARRRRVVVADYSQERNATLEELAAEIGSAARAALDDDLDLLGQSIGTILAVQVAARAGIPIRRVVLIGTFTRLRSHMLRLADRAGGRTPRWLYRLSAPALMAIVCGPVGDGWRHPFLVASSASDPVGTRKRTAWQIDRDFGADLAGLDRETLVLMGQADRFVPGVAHEIATLRRLFAGRPVRVVPVAGAGHVLMPSRAIKTAVAEVEAFLG